MQILNDYYFGFPILFDGAEILPPEGVGGMDDFYEFMEIQNNENHPENESILEWAESL